MYTGEFKIFLCTGARDHGHGSRPVDPFTDRACAREPVTGEVTSRMLFYDS